MLWTYCQPSEVLVQLITGLQRHGHFIKSQGLTVKLSGSGCFVVKPTKPQQPQQAVVHRSRPALHCQKNLCRFFSWRLLSFHARGRWGTD